jgi:hypothetical protein
VAVGADASEFLTTGTLNTAVGHDSNRYNTTGYNCTFVGQGAGTGTSGSTTGYNNTGIGKGALNDITTGHDNCAVGSFAADNLTTGSDNTYVGDNAGNTHATGSACTLVGRANNTSTTDVSNEAVFGASLAGKGSQTCFLGGTTGTFNAANETHFDTTSDSRIKKNITNYNTGLSIINQFQVRNFEYKTENEIITDNPELKDVVKSAVVEKTGTQTGLIAQEAEAVLASTVVTNSTGIKSLHTDDIFWHMLNAIKELSAKVTALEAG